MKDKMHIEVQLTNAGETDVYVWDWIFCWGQGSSLSIHALNASGKWVQPASSVLLDCIPPPPKEGNPAQFVRIQPARFYGMADEFDLRDVVDGPGERTLIIGLSGVIGRDFIRKLGYADLPYWTSEDKPVFAKVKITVTP